MDSRQQVQEEAKRVSSKWWSQQHGKSVEEILALLKTPSGTRPNPMIGRARQSAASMAGNLPDLDLLVQQTAERDAIMGRAHINRQIIESQFGRPGLPVTADPTYGLNIPGYEAAPNAVAAAFANPHRTQALADEMARLGEMYPNTVARMMGITVGRGSNAEGWNQEYYRTSGSRPGEVPYMMGTPAEASLVRNPGKILAHELALENSPDGLAIPYRQSPPSSATQPGWSASGDNLYPNSFNRTGAHEFGHAIHSSMHDFAEELHPNSPARGAYRSLITDLGLGDQNYISGYADYGRQRQTGSGGQVTSMKNAAAEPFAELFQASRSPQGVDFLNKHNSTPALRDVVGDRQGTRALKMADKVGQLNSVEKALRNEGWGEVAKASPNLLAGIAAPMALGLLAAKTKGTTRDVLGGAATGAGIGSMYGLPGIGLGALAGGGVGLAKQLLG